MKRAFLAFVAAGAALVLAPTVADADDVPAPATASSAAQPAASSAGSAPAAGARDCARITAERAAAQDEQRHAQTRQADAWKAVVPFAVAGRYAKARAASNDAAARVDALAREAAERGCDAR